MVFQCEKVPCRSRPSTHISSAPRTFMNKPTDHEPFTPLSGVAKALWDEMLASYEDWTPTDLRTLATLCQDAGIIADCDALMAAGDNDALAITRLDLRRDRAVKRFMRAVRELNLTVAPPDSRPPRIAGRY